MPQKLLRFNLCAPENQRLQELETQTLIKKSMLIRLAIAYALPHVDELEISHQKGIGATHYINAYVPEETEKRLSELAITNGYPKGTLARRLIEYALETNQFLPAHLSVAL